LKGFSPFSSSNWAMCSRISPIWAGVSDMG